MKYTAEQLRELSDELIEKEVHDILVGKDSKLDNYFKSFRPKKYCSTPNDIMPIVFENKIELGYRNVTDLAKAFHCGHIMEDGYSEQFIFLSYNENPLRAFCEVFILMKQESDND